MIKIHALLKESLATYKLNFKKIIFMTAPIFVLGLVSGYAQGSYETVIDNPSVQTSQTIIMALLAMLVYLVITLGIALFFQPAFNRAIQKNEDTAVFEPGESFAFQRKGQNIWKWIKLSFIVFAYIVWKMLPFLSVPLVLYGVYFSGITNNIFLIVAAVVSFGAILAGFVLNAPRFVFANNIFFSKDVAARDAVRQSIALGDEKRGLTWKIIFTGVVFGLYVSLAFVVVILIAGAVAYVIGFDAVAQYFETNYIIPITIVSYLLSAFSVMFATPISFIISAKGYNTLK